MKNLFLIIPVGVIFILFSTFALWYLRREYHTSGKLSRLGALIHVITFAVNGMFICIIAWGPDDIPPMGSLAPLGIVLMVLGLGITIYAMDMFRLFSRWLGNRTPGLTTRGLYRYSRNPQFVGYGLLILGICIAWWTPLNLLGIASYAVLAYTITRIEEEHLAKIYGEPYQEYCANTPRFIGCIR